MIRTTDLVLFAARGGLVLHYSIAREALMTVDREALENAEAQRYTVLPWDGQGNPPIGTRDRWLHGKDAISEAAIEAANHPSHGMYFLLKDGKLHHWQPFRAYDRGRIPIVMDDEQHPDHWRKAAADHVAVEVEQAVDQQILHLALDKALELHEARGIPVGVAPVFEMPRRA